MDGGNAGPVSAVSQEFVIHAGEEAVALSHFSTEQSHPFDGASILEIACIDVTEWRTVREFEKSLLRRGIVGDHEKIA